MNSCGWGCKGLNGVGGGSLPSSCSIPTLESTRRPPSEVPPRPPRPRKPQSDQYNTKTGMEKCPHINPPLNSIMVIVWEWILYYTKFVSVGSCDFPYLPSTSPPRGSAWRDCWPANWESMQCFKTFLVEGLQDVLNNSRGLQPKSLALHYTDLGWANDGYWSVNCTFVLHPGPVYWDLTLPLFVL